MKNKFCTIFLYLFALDGILGLFRGTTTLLGSDISHGALYQFFAGVFTFGIVACAVVQITIGFVLKLRWSARIIGMYVIFYSIISIIIGFVFGIYSGLQGLSAVEEQTLVLLRSSFLNIYGIIIGLVQVILFFWALKDLSKGHYLYKK
ncbi:hypothetical protein KAX75_08130 [candidate division WOR-3 bacterium]|nr:hypothetical protein [candidate division WOR-3 bacterium]